MKMTEIKKNCIHITHNDGDAVGCALVASIVFEDYDFLNNTYFCTANGGSKKLNSLLDEYEKMDEDEFPKFILMSDLSLDEETCDRLEKLKEKYDFELVGIDHHVHNTLNNKYKWYIVDTNFKYDKMTDLYIPTSAAKLMLLRYDLVFAKNFRMNLYNKLSEIIDSISRYDTWAWKEYANVMAKSIYPFKDDIIAIVTKALGAEETYNQLYEFYFKNYFNEEDIYKTSPIVPYSFQFIYDIEKRKEESYLKSLKSKVHVAMYKGFKVAAFFNDDIYVNSGMEWVYNTYEGLDIVCAFYPNNRQISLRTKRGDLNLGIYCKNNFSGGGHPKAAGATVCKETFFEFINLYYDSITLSEYENMEKINYELQSKSNE